MADITHSKGFSATENGYSVGTVGNEVTVISQTGSFIVAGTTLSTANRITKIAKVALSATADTSGAILSWVNPETTAIVITRLVLDITTKSTGACTVDFGTTATTATTLSDNLIDGLDINAAIGTFDNITDKGTNGRSRQKLAVGKWLTGSTASGAVAGTVGFAYIEYFLI